MKTSIANAVSRTGRFASYGEDYLLFVHHLHGFGFFSMFYVMIWATLPKMKATYVCITFSSFVAEIKHAINIFAKSVSDSHEQHSLQLIWLFESLDY